MKPDQPRASCLARQPVSARAPQRAVVQVLSFSSWTEENQTNKQTTKKDASNLVQGFRKNGHFVHEAG